MPENDYVPRFEDPRVGYFVTQTTDMTSADDPTPYRDMIHRWNLEKKNPEQARSEVKEPITWWIENTTPHEFRDAIKEGVLAWNKAFEKAGQRLSMGRGNLVRRAKQLKTLGVSSTKQMPGELQDLDD